MRSGLFALMLVVPTCYAFAIDLFQTECSKAFDDFAQTRAGASWKGANKGRYCRCVKQVFGGSAERLADYRSQGSKSGSVAEAEVNCFIASDLTTKSRYR